MNHSPGGYTNLLLAFTVDEQMGGKFVNTHSLDESSTQQNKSQGSGMHPAPPARKPQRRTRLLVPDSTRGLMLLGIAIANISTVWLMTPGVLGAELGGIVEDNLLDKITIIFTATFVHARGFPIFTTMLGFGLGLIAASLFRRGFPLSQARKVIVRRYGLLALFGVVHMVFLFWGDIMMVYGLMGMLIATMISMRTKTLLIIAGGLFGSYLALILLGSALMDSWGLSLLFTESNVEEILVAPTYLRSLITGLAVFVGQIVSSPVQIAMLLPHALLGFLLARHNILQDASTHRHLLRKIAVVGLGAGIVTGVPYGLSLTGVLPESMLWSSLTMSVGTLAGPGFIALVALVFEPVQSRLMQDDRYAVPLGLRVLDALGKRSMTGYVLQSVLCIILFAPYGLGLFAHSGAFTALLAGTGVWVVTVLIAWVLEGLNQPGPLERLHRRLSYGSEGLPHLWGSASEPEKNVLNSR